ncbi:acyltransferase family protein [Microvirga zambiensis]|uniref:acyltransferase family protein n=1 Tax=Microvirga zambiensis TaxID=1402137 RepID=UPI00191D4E58|nr:acyltransferase [Microvirga zambiensis]
MTRYRNFDTLRLIAASSVIFSHSFFIAEGHERNEPFAGPFGHILAIYGVFIFFILSGLLVTQSMMDARSLSAFSLKRLGRIVPGLLVCNVLTILVAVEWFYEGTWLQFLAEHGRMVLASLSLISDGPYFNGLELYPSPIYLGTILNGSLWTIQQEVLSYGLIALLFCIGGLNLTMAALLFYAVLCMQYFGFWGFNKFMGNFILVAPCFFAGMIMYFVLRYHRPAGSLALICLVLLAGATYLCILDYAFPLLAAYLIAYLGTTAPINLGNAARFGDLSYGTYLYGWPVQQLVRAWLGEGAQWWEIFAVSLPAALALGFVSWHLVEKPALRLFAPRSGRKPLVPHASMDERLSVPDGSPV